MSIGKDILQEYEALAAMADRDVSGLMETYSPLVKCGVQCSDCCHSVFGLFLIESAYISHHFSGLEESVRQEGLAMADRADRELLEVEKKLQVYDNNLPVKAVAMARERVRCPLLDQDEKCLIYPHRPITCRVYGIPAVINGSLHACWKAGFEKDKSYEAFDLDRAYQELYRLSQKLLIQSGQKDLDRASLLVSVSKSIKTPAADLIAGA
jgi:Fe-S-cluster containining protein